MSKKKVKEIKKCSALGITFVFIGVCIALAIIDSHKKTPETANEELETLVFDL